MTRTLVRLMLPQDAIGYYIEVDPDHITGMHQMGNGRETRLHFRDGRSTKVTGSLPEVCRKLYKKSA